MTVDHIISLIEQGMPTLLIVVGIVFLYIEFWPYWKAEREFQQSLKTKRQENEHAADLANAEATKQMAAALSSLARSVVDCPLKPANAKNDSEEPASFI